MLCDLRVRHLIFHLNLSCNCLENIYIFVSFFNGYLKDQVPKIEEIYRKCFTLKSLTYPSALSMRNMKIQITELAYENSTFLEVCHLCGCHENQIPKKKVHFF